jgi:hypothetical protein
MDARPGKRDARENDFAIRPVRDCFHELRRAGIRNVGERKGKLEGTAKVLSTLLTRKFGEVPAWASARISQADEATLNRWAVQILDAQRIEDVFL